MARMTLDELVRQLGLAYGPSLRCVALYGSAARGEQVARSANLNVLVLVDSIDMERLKREAPVARAWRGAGNPPPLTLTVAEWVGSADIFPMEYADIMAHHRILHGELPGTGEVKLHELRLQLEHEVRSKLLRLRHEILSSGADPKAIATLLGESASSIMVLLRSALRVAGEAPPADSSAMLDRVEAATGISVEPFRQALRQSRGEIRLAGPAAVEAGGAYLDGVAALATWVDAHRVP